MLKPPPDRLYGRQRGHKLRARQERLLAETAPRLRLAEAAAARPLDAFAGPVDEVWLEIGFGGGEHAFAQIAANPRAGLIAAEVFATGICSLLSRLVPDGEEATGTLPLNLRLWDSDARTLLRLLPAASISLAFLLFPDPWPKARHAKRRFVHPETVALMARVLRPGGMWRIASDDPTYQQWVETVMRGRDDFVAPPAVSARPEGWPPTRYEAKALSAGRVPMYWCFTRSLAGGHCEPGKADIEAQAPVSLQGGMS